MLGRIPGQGISDQREPITRQAVGDDKDSMMRTLVMEHLDRKTDKVVAVSSHQAASLVGSPVELVSIRTSVGTHLVGTDRIKAPRAKQLSDRLAEVLVEVVCQDRSAAREGYRSASRSCVHTAFRASCRSISSG